jgi:hypothetical protein
MTNKLSKQFIDRAKAVTAKRPKTVIDHILANGRITTDELKTLYGYNHAPRAARDVREQGIGLKTTTVKSADGRSIAEYTFDEVATVNYSKRSGRTALSNKLKKELIKLHGAFCFIYLETSLVKDLQVDHRVPYEVAGDTSDQMQNAEDFMLLSGSANRAKSWVCEHCPNLLIQKKIEVCKSCYWAYPESYTHVATVAQRRLDVVWTGDEVVDYETIRLNAAKTDQTLPEYVKNALRKIQANQSS